MFLWILFVITAVIYYVCCAKPHFYWSEKNVIHKKPWPIVGNFGPLVFRRTSIAELVQDIYKSYNNCRYLGFYQFLQPTLIIRDPNLIKQIGIKDFESFLDRQMVSEEIEPLFGKNLFALRGQKWRHMRSTLSPAFTGSKMRSMYTLIADTAEQFTNYFIEETKVKKTNLDVEMKDIFTRFASDIIATTAFGVQVDSLKEKKNEFYLKGKDAANFSGIRGLKFFGYAISPMLMKLFKVKIFSDETSDFFRHLVHDTIATRKEKDIVRPDMIHLLMQAKKGKLKHEETKGKDDAGFATVEETQVGHDTEFNPKDLTDDDLTAQALLFFLAGFESVSTNMCFLSYELAIDPDIQKRLQSEIDDAFEEENGKMNYDSIMKMKYLDRVIAEGLRKWPSALVADRACNKPYTIQPVGNEEPLNLEIGVLCWIPIYAIHRDSEYYPEPEKFDPERFNDENKDKIDPMTYMPFGVGPRNCIGSRFALLEIKTVMVHLLRKFNIVPNKKTSIPIRLCKRNLHLASETGFHLTLQQRADI